MRRRPLVRLPEAIIQFELYRFLKNSIEKRSFYPPIKYSDIIPEYPLGKGIGKESVDLVVMVKSNQMEKPFLAIETKEKTASGVKPFRPEARNQTLEYALRLKAPYYSITDGFSLLLFEAPERRIGAYKITLDQSFAKRFLKELADLYAHRISRLSFPEAKDPYERLKATPGAIMHTARGQLVKELGRRPTRDELIKRVKELWEELKGE